MKRVLLISTENPFPADSGGRLRLRAIVDVLARRFSVDLVTFERAENEDLAEARSRLNIVQVPRTVTTRGAAVRSLYRGRNCGYMGHADVDMMSAARALCRTSSYHAVLIDNTMLGYFIAPLRRLQPHAAFITIAHNFETGLCEQLVESQTRAVRRAFFSLSAFHTRREERRVCRETNLLLTTSTDEAERFARLEPSAAAKAIVLPSCIDAGSYDRFRHVRPDRDAIVFSGDMAYFPNVAGALHFYTHIYPALKAARPGLTWYIVGRNPHRSIVDMVKYDPSVIVTGYVPIAAEYVARSAVFVVPLLHGSGTRLKILEAWALDRPVVTTSKGCEGLDCEPGHDILVADTPAAFVDAVGRLLDDGAMAERIAQNGRATLLARYDIRVIEQTLLDAMGETISSHGVAMRHRRHAG